MPNIRTLLSHLRSSATSEREKGTYFERVALSFLKNDPGMAQEYDDAWTFQEWASLNGVSAADTGVDLVARIRDGGGYCAVQCDVPPASPSIIVRAQGVDSRSASPAGAAVRRS